LREGATKVRVPPGAMRVRGLCSLRPGLFKPARMSCSRTTWERLHRHVVYFVYGQLGPRFE